LFSRYMDYFLRVKRPERQVGHLPPSCAEVKDKWSYTLTPPICLQGVDRDEVTFHLHPLRHVAVRFVTANQTETRRTRITQFSSDL
jgi:hypothetical protein